MHKQWKEKNSIKFYLKNLNCILAYELRWWRQRKRKTLLLLQVKFGLSTISLWKRMIKELVLPCWCWWSLLSSCLFILIQSYHDRPAGESSVYTFLPHSSPSSSLLKTEENLKWLRWWYCMMSCSKNTYRHSSRKRQGKKHKHPKVWWTPLLRNTRNECRRWLSSALRLIQLLLIILHSPFLHTFLSFSLLVFFYRFLLSFFTWLSNKSVIRCVYMGKGRQFNSDFFIITGVLPADISLFLEVFL